MNIVGSSSVGQVGSYTVLKGVTGITGPTGPVGFTGPGITGNTGASVIGVSLVDRQILISFDDGSTYLSPTKIYGATGNFKYILDFKNNGTGISLAYSVSDDKLFLRPIRIVPNGGLVSINTTSNDVTIGVIPTATTGLTLFAIPGVSASHYFTKFKSKKSRRIPIAWDPNSTTGVYFPSANLFQKVRGMGYNKTGGGGGSNCVGGPEGITCIIDPFVTESDAVMFGSTSKIFIGDFSGNTASFQIAPCPAGDGIAYGFDLYIENAKNPTDLTKRFTSGSPIKWPRNEIPCFNIFNSTTELNKCKIKVSFFGIDGTWYATPKTLGLSCSNAQIFKPHCDITEQTLLGQQSRRFLDVSEYYLPSADTIIGACCRADGSCIETIPANCDGYFHGYETTCGDTFSSICNQIGACCISPGYGEEVFTCYEMTCAECLGITGAYGNYAGNGTVCGEISCNNIQNDIGACCDGLGHCVESTLNDCISANGFYQGNGSRCFDKDIAVCSTGTGPCCINGNCSEQSAESCFSQNGYYLGKQRTCYDFTCPKNVSCVGYLDGIPLVAGQNYGGGIIVGKYEPGTTKILGAKQWFDPRSIDIIPGITVYPSEEYVSYLDHTAYGITKDCQFLNESYIIVVYPRDLEIDTQTSVFTWGGTGSSWGPILDSAGNYSDFVLHYKPEDFSIVPIQYWNTHLKYGEGYWSTGNTADYNNLLLNTFPTCAAANMYGSKGVERVFAKTPYSLHGLWHQSWGLYNTIRAIHAHNTYTKQTNLEGVFSYTEYVKDSTPNAFDWTRLLNDGITSDIQGITGNSYALSGWYIPSHDELGFIAANTKDLFGFNINNQLMLTPTGQPLNGLYWTSTGSFDYTKNEGIYTDSTKPTPGSVAISMNIDVNGSNYYVAKTSRQTPLKVRPIRMLRCDAKIPENRYLWLIPSVATDINRQINQRDIDTISIEAP